MTDTETQKLTVAEETLRDVLVLTTAERVLALVQHENWPRFTEPQMHAMTATAVRAWTHFVLGMRAAGAGAPSREQLNEVIEGVAQGLLHRETLD